jgi:hypothetical protein
MNKDENSITGWVELNYSLGAEENGWYSINEITINTSVDIIYFAFQSNQKANQGIYFLLDNFSVTGTITSTHFKTLAENNFMCYPNPVTRESVISFQTAKSENINLTIFDIQGRKIYTLLDKRLNAGKHTLPLGNTIQSNGIYFCKLATSEGVSTLKLIVNK